MLPLGRLLAGRRMAGAGLLLWAFVSAGVVGAELVRGKTASGNAPRAVFGEIARAWEAADEEALTALIHPDGLSLTSGRANERATHYSPSQAYYFFRNTFKTYRTLLFEFEMTQDTTAGSRVHGVAVWKRRHPDSTEIEAVRLVCVLVRLGDRWQLAEINTIR